jgi:uncharacterized protein YbjQ (UPF0145 family)
VVGKRRAKLKPSITGLLALAAVACDPATTAITQGITRLGDLAALMEPDGDAKLYPVAPALEPIPHRAALSGVDFYFADEPPPTVSKKHGTFTTTQRAEARGDYEAACSKALVEALLRFKRRALHEGGNAVIGIVSVWQERDFVSATQYQCIIGRSSAAVELKATVVTVER